MSTFLRRSIVAAAAVLLVAAAAGGPGSPREATANDVYQYSIGTKGENCGGTCPGGNWICCRIDIAPAPPP